MTHIDKRLSMSYCRKSMEICEQLGAKNGMATVHGAMAIAYMAR